jgi:hypothetical protein
MRKLSYAHTRFLHQRLPPTLSEAGLSRVALDLHKQNPVTTYRRFLPNMDSQELMLIRSHDFTSQSATNFLARSELVLPTRCT